ncbi:hypothetical protein BDV27DRAFT_156619 [Aspergillus caelatus]|uniref:Uncharacterized protein n=1 Tax=Aspergillus caelatus TaxID=61420 RepID=A0A5N7A9E1_9EURO|nr:uncharacterized protein BDV27DRAFT_156619 [Aspergillus caelatus]KAE8365739.1 hypothetical protein BDV27DRAFT_156619 [Aspergillus caelatus]
MPSSPHANRQARQVVSIAIAPGGGALFTCARCLIAFDPSDSVVIQGAMSGDIALGILFNGKVVKKTEAQSQPGG